MVKAILLSSTKSGSGKSAIAIGLFLKLKENGYNPGYFKPIGDPMSMEPNSRTDKDVNVITTVVARKFSKEELCPVFLNSEYFLDEVLPTETAGLIEKIKDAFNLMAKKTNYIIIEGNHDIHQFRALDMDDARWAKEFGAEIVICSPINDDDDINDVIVANDFYKGLGLKVAGAILNGQNETSYVRIEKYHKALLEKRGISVIGGLHESRTLQKPTIAEVIDAVQGRMISGNFIKVKHMYIDNFIIGAMGAEAALSYLRKSVDTCLITGGDRTDIALAALETNTKLIVFTGNMEPPKSVISKAEEKEIPLVVAPADTFTVSERIRKIHTHIQPNEIQLCKDQVDKYIDWKKIPK
jgi:uncharacterized protein